MNTFRFAYMTKKGVNSLINRIPEFDLHTAITLEGREDGELPEQTLLCVCVPVSSVQCQVLSVTCSVSSVQCQVFGELPEQTLLCVRVRCSMCIVHCSLFIVHCSLFSTAQGA